MRRFLPFAALGGLFFLFLTLTSGGPETRYTPVAWGQTYSVPTTWLGLSKYTRITTLNPATALMEVSIPNTVGTTYLTRGISVGNALNGWYLTTWDKAGLSTIGHTHNYINTFDANAYITSSALNSRGYLTTVNLSPYLTTYTDTTGGGLTTTDLAGYQFVNTTQLAARNYISSYDWSFLSTTGHLHSQYLTTVNLSPYLTSFDWSFLATTGHDHPLHITTSQLASRQFVSTTDLAARGYITWAGVSTTGHVHAQYLTTFVVPSEYITSSALNARGYLTTYTDTIGSGSFSEGVSYTWRANQQFGTFGIGNQTAFIMPAFSGWASGQWHGPAVMGNVSTNVGTGAILYRTGGLWAPFSAITTGNLPSGMAYTAIGTSAPGLVLLKGAFVKMDALTLSTTSPIYFAGTTSGSISPTVTNGTGHTVVTILLHLWNNVIQFIFGDSWGTR